MTNNTKLENEIEKAYAKQKAMLPKKEPKKKYTRIEHLSHIMAWLMMILMLGSLIFTALLSSGII